MNIRFAIAPLAVLLAAVAIWSASPVTAGETVAQAMPVASPAPSPSPTPTPPPHALQVSAYADFGYSAANLATANNSGLGFATSAAGYPTTSNSSFITGRVFDYQNQMLTFHTFNITAAYTGPIGATIEFNGGDDAGVINSYPKNTYAPFTGYDITQAFISGTSGQFTGIVGKFETLAGAEVIESPNDYEFSRGILFGYAVPFTHTGGRLTWAASPTVSVIAGLNKGWDTTSTIASAGDTNPLTIEGGLVYNGPVFGLTLDGYTGKVPQGFAQVNSVAYLNSFGPGAVNPFVLPTIGTVGPVPNRSLIDLVATFHASPALTFKYNLDVGSQTNTNLLDNTGAIVGFGTATWSGMALYANYAFTPKLSGTVRGEYMYDGGGSRTGITQRWGEVTLTGQYNPAPNLTLRAEVRGDQSKQLFFFGGNLPTPGIFRYRSNVSEGFEAIVHT